MPEEVTEYEARAAAQEYQYSWTRWQRLSGNERATIIAHRRLRQLIAIHEHDAVVDHSQSQQRRMARQ